MTIVEGEAERADDASWAGELYGGAPVARTSVPIHAVPYYAWDHRTAGEMRVWLRAAE